MLKKLLALLCAAVLLLALAGCATVAMKIPNLPVPGEEEPRLAPDSTNYDDNLAGLFAYLEDGKALVRDTKRVQFNGDGTITAEEGLTSFVQTSYQEIGAVNGWRCIFTFNNSTVQAEFYEFDPENMTEKGKACVASVQENGWFEVLGNRVEATAHPAGKYLMVYTDDASGKREANAAQEEWIRQLFMDFHAR